jgi:ABC-2 type transport system ATP-binding protein
MGRIKETGVRAIIEVEDLTKWYGWKCALGGVTFEVGEGQIVGFLGPNGAGKSTTLRILTGFLPATSGRAAVGGHDVFSDSLALRRSIGYMPENVPLYPEMRVSEYLKFRSSLKGLAGRSGRAAVERVTRRCGLLEEQRRLIGQLSKGFRQRVGLADALLGEPPVLILDEPTIGLDPSQIQEVRQLIRSLGGDHTVLLSSHILPEVEKTCSHLVIIAGGHIAAAGSMEDLRQGLAARHLVTMEVRPAKDGPAEVVRAVGQVAGVGTVDRQDAGDGWMRLVVTPSGERDLREALVALAHGRAWGLREVHRQVPTLEDLYLKITAGETAAQAAEGRRAAPAA